MREPDVFVAYTPGRSRPALTHAGAAAARDRLLRQTRSPVADHSVVAARRRRVGNAFLDDLTLPKETAIAPCLLWSATSPNSLRLAALRMHKRTTPSDDRRVFLGRNERTTTDNHRVGLGRNGKQHHDARNPETHGMSSDDTPGVRRAKPQSQTCQADRCGLPDRHLLTFDEVLFLSSARRWAKCLSRHSLARLSCSNFTLGAGSSFTSSFRCTKCRFGSRHIRARRRSSEFETKRIAHTSSVVNLAFIHTRRTRAGSRSRISPPPWA